jgi:GT2 family glycosyltransferase
MSPDARLPLPPEAPVERGQRDRELNGGCSCRERRGQRATPPLLTDDLVIAARDRAREPELPDATVARALATPVAPRLARYDVVIVSLDRESTERDRRLASEFARHEHRVFHFGDHQGDRRPIAPTLHRLPTLATGAGQFDQLADLRRRERLEATIVLAASDLDRDTARTVRQDWGWRTATLTDALGSGRASAGLALSFPADDLASRPTQRALPTERSWPGTWAALDKAIREVWPRASVIVLTRDNLAFNRMCLASVLENTEYPNYELIVVDNGSTDGTGEELTRLTGTIPHLKVILNHNNAGFGPGNNQGLAAATGDILLLLNNDTVVPRGWLSRLARYLDDPALALIGPATNRTCNEAQINIPYQTYGEYLAVARTQAERFAGERYPIRMPMMFCTAMTRATFERLGPLDERFEVGLFEDEDYALRAKAAGLTVAWTPEVYVHHAYHATTGKLLPTGEYARLVAQNQGRFEEKWGICWERHRPIPQPAPSG